MSLPKNCLYTNAIESSYARNYNNNIAPQNGTGDYGVGQTILINIPTGRNLVMSGADSVLKFKMQIKNGATESNFTRLDAAGAHSIIQRVRVIHGSTVLSDIDDYNNLVSMMMSLQQSSDSTQGKMSILAGLNGSFNSSNCTGNAGYKLNETTATAISAATPDKTYFTIPIMNFLSYSEKYIPLFAMTGAPLRLEIQLVADVLHGVCCAQPVSATNPLVVNDVEYICNFMEISDSGMQTIQNAIGGGPLKWVVQDYKAYSHTATVAANTALSVPVPSKFNSLRSLYVSSRLKATGDVTFFPLSSNSLGLASYTWRLGSRTVPTKPPASQPEFFAELIRAIGCISDLNHEPNIGLSSYSPLQSVANTEAANVKVPTQGSSCSFYTGLDLESYSNSGMTSVYQGYNSSTDDIFYMPYYGADGVAGSARFTVYAFFDAVVIIENGACTVQN